MHHTHIHTHSQGHDTYHGKAVNRAGPCERCCLRIPTGGADLLQQAPSIDGKNFSSTTKENEATKNRREHAWFRGRAGEVDTLQHTCNATLEIRMCMHNSMRHKNVLRYLLSLEVNRQTPSTYIPRSTPCGASVVLNEFFIHAVGVCFDP